MTDIDITITDRLAVTAPYNTTWTAQAKRLGGRWNPASKQWTFDLRDEDRVRAALVEIYGTDGSPVGETVTVHLNLDEFGCDQEIVFAGRVVASRAHRDRQPVLSGAVIVSGGFPSSGGSVKHPRLKPQDGTVLEIRDVPAGHADLARPGVTVIDRTIDREALAAERAALLARVAEIDALLA